MHIFLILVVLVYGLSAKALFSNSEQAGNAKYIDALKDLVIATQKTRGLTNSYLNGNESTLLLIHSNKRDIKTAIGKMESLPLASNTVINARATAISQALIKLDTMAFKQEPSVTFQNYTEQIEQILMLAQTVSKKGSEDLNDFGKEASEIMMEVILPFTEEIGKMRGMGSGVVAKKSITEAQKFAISSMLSEIARLDSKLQSDMNSLVSGHQELFTTSIREELSMLKKRVSDYKKLTNEKVLVKNVDQCDSTQYFSHGSDIISTLVTIFELTNQAIVKDSKGWI